MAKIIGVDFGTTRSYFSICPANVVKPQGVTFGGAKEGVATAVLYRDGTAVPLIGDEALQEWSELPPGEKKGCLLRTQFKPDIAVNQEARNHATKFLAAALKELKKVNAESGSRFVFGIPSEADAAYAHALKAIAKDAGYGDIDTMEEPVGALWFHLDRRDIGLDQAQDGVLIIDFGGGTCDFAYMCRFKVVHSWGDMQLGGRLFDDLFFQWFLDKNPGVLENLLSRNDEYIVHWYYCQEAKEHFSRTMAGYRYRPANKAIGNYGSMSGMTWEDFLGRAKRYTPSDQFREMMRQSEEAYGRLAQDHCIDLLEWFSTLLEDGLKTHQIRPSDVQQVILTGGSSQWPFVREIVRDLLRVDDSRVYQSANPNATIGTGLALCPAATQGFRKKSQDLRNVMPRFLSTQVLPALDEYAKGTIDAICQDVDSQLYDGTVRCILHELADNGGRVAESEDRISDAVRAFEPTLVGIIARHIETLNGAMSHRVERLVKEWLEDNELPTTTFKAALQVSSSLHPTTPVVGVPNVWLLVSCVGLALCGGVLGLFVKGVLGAAAVLVVLAVLLGIFGKRLWKWTRMWSVPADVRLGSKKVPFARWFLRKEKTDRLTAKVRHRFRADLVRQMGNAMQDPKREVRRALEELVDRIQRI